MPAINGFGNNFNSRKGIPSSNRGPSNTNTLTQRGKIEDLKRQLSGGQLENCQCPEDKGEEDGGKVGKPDNKFTTMMDGEEDRGGKIEKPKNPIADKNDNKFTTLMIGEEDEGGKIEKPKNPIADKNDNKFTTLMIGEEDGGGKIGKPKNPIADKPDNKFTTMMIGEEDNQKNLYSAIRSNFPPNKNNFNITFNSDLS